MLTLKINAYEKVFIVGEEGKNVKVGDVVIFHQSGDQAIITNGIIQRVLKNNEVYGIVILLFTPSSNTDVITLLSVYSSAFAS